MEAASRESKALVLFNSVKSLGRTTTQFQELIRELRGVVPCVECNKPGTEEIPSVMTVLNETPGAINNINEELHKIIAELREILF